MVRAQTAVTTDTSQKFAIGVVIDAHPQQQDVIEFQRQVVESLRVTLTNIRADVFVISYSDRVQQTVDWSPADSGLTASVGRIASDGAANRGAVLNDGLMEGLARLGPANGDRKALVVIGEGNDSGSMAKFSQILDTASKTHVQCFALFVATHRAQVGRVRQYGFDLMRLASKTKGKIYDVRTNPQSLDKAMKDLRARLMTPVRF